MKTFLLLFIAIFIICTESSSQFIEYSAIGYNDPIAKTANGFSSADERNNEITNATVAERNKRAREHDEMTSQQREDDRYIAGNCGADRDPNTIHAGHYSPTSWGANGFETVEQQNAKMKDAVNAERRRTG